MEYHKIQTVWLRDPATNHKTLLDGRWAKPEFEYLKDNSWLWTEKVDGTNIRIRLRDGKASVGGKTDNAQIPAFLIGRLREIGDAALAAGLDNMTLYGEGYGAKIQKGVNYLSDRSDFVLFDVWCDMWLERINVEDIAAQVGIGVVPIVGRSVLMDAIRYARDGFNSKWGAFSAEGLVMRPAVELINRRGERVITKIKSKDFSHDSRVV